MLSAASNPLRTVKLHRAATHWLFCFLLPMAAPTFTHSQGSVATPGTSSLLELLMAISQCGLLQQCAAPQLAGHGVTQGLSAVAAAMSELGVYVIGIYVVLGKCCSSINTVMHPHPLPIMVCWMAPMEPHVAKPAMHFSAL